MSRPSSRTSKATQLVDAVVVVPRLDVVMRDEVGHGGVVDGGERHAERHRLLRRVRLLAIAHVDDRL
eukprot:5089281-Prymnesium_polylepis.1